jgi:hypothetical protein
MRKTTAPTHALRAVFTGIGQAFMAADRVKERITEEPDAAGRAAASAADELSTAHEPSAANEPGAAHEPGATGRASSGADAGLAVRLLDPDGTERPRTATPGTAGTTADKTTADNGRAGGRSARSHRSRRGAAEPAGPRWRSLDQTGNVRLLSAEDLLDELPPLPPADDARQAARAAGYAAAPDAPLTSDYSYDGGHQGGYSADDDRQDGYSAGDDRQDGSATTATAIMTELAGNAAEGAEADPAQLPVPGYDLLSVASLRARLRNLDVDQVRELADYERAHTARPDVVTMFERRVAKLTGDE